MSALDSQLQTLNGTALDRAWLPRQSRQRFLWGAPIFEVLNPCHESLKADLVSYCHESMRRDGGGVVSGVMPQTKEALYESRFNAFEADDPAVQSVRRFCVGALTEALRSLLTEHTQDADDLFPAVDIHEAWIHVTAKGGYHRRHIHGNCSWCGVYYVDAGDTTDSSLNGATEFYPPFSPTYEDFGTRLCSLGPIQVSAKDGVLVLFPSYIPHCARIYDGDRDRIVFAFNSRVSSSRDHNASCLSFTRESS